MLISPKIQSKYFVLKSRFLTVGISLWKKQTPDLFDFESKEIDNSQIVVEGAGFFVKSGDGNSVIYTSYGQSSKLTNKRFTINEDQKLVAAVNLKGNYKLLKNNFRQSV